MSSQESPPTTSSRKLARSWFDRAGMWAWVDGMATALRARVRLLDEDGVELAAAGAGQGTVWRRNVEVNGQPVGSVEVRPSPTQPDVIRQLDMAVTTFRSLAEARNSISDLAKTTANQWRELSVLYRSSRLLHGGLDAAAVADHLLHQATTAIRDAMGVVSFRVSAAGPTQTTLSEGSEELLTLVDWAESLPTGVIISHPAEMRRVGFNPQHFPSSVLAIPLRCGDQRHGCMILARPRERAHRAEDLKLARLLADQAGQAFTNLALLEQVRENERLRQELVVASQIQKQILPASNTNTGWVDVFGMCEPAQWVGGDAFLVLPTPPSANLLVAVADVSGHGVSSALLMNSFASILKALLLTSQSPGKLLTTANDIIAERVGDSGMFVTAVLMCLSPDGRIVVANAGHPQPVLANPDSDTILVEESGLPLGILEGEAYPEQELQVEPGASLVLYSDGLTEAQNVAGEMFQTSRLVEAVARRCSMATTSEELAGLIRGDLQQFTDGRALEDDLTLVAMRMLAQRS